jgi:hypothetical protein
LIEDFAKTFSASHSPRAELARLCRRICVEQEKTGGDFTSLDEHLRGALGTVRDKFGPTSISEDELLDIFRREHARVTDAAVVAELLAPLITRGVEQPASTKVTSAVHPVAPGETKIPASETPSSEPSRASANAPLGIADFIDGMLDQDRREARNRRPAGRF